MSHTERAFTVTRREFVVPADPAYGANHAEISKAWTSATRSYREAHQLPADAPLPDNAIAFWPAAAEIVISYETEKPASPSADDVAVLLATHDHRGGRISLPYAHLAAAVQEEYRATARTVIDALGLGRP
ncbi:hypothetical protein [Streptomyces cylindrosporus]|uniref:Uncharacterized protein n=1 Tax=Streptomyces cylindrosporus TaxID=2927583 RepID=A0ABS9YJZ7_9ACTN|nr:hypothetical protein [Streptomyces cylindrosporus]MCI3277580.1 hypothetical protein [Streptomyces cylindrosporus]